MAQIVDQQISASDIIRKDLERGGFTKEEDKFLRGLKILIEQQKAMVVRHNNTVFVGIRKKPGTLEVHMYTLDTPNMLAGAIKVGIDAVKKAGVKKLESETYSFIRHTTTSLTLLVRKNVKNLLMKPGNLLLTLIIIHGAFISQCF